MRGTSSVLVFTSSYTWQFIINMLTPMLQTMINHKSCNHANVGQHIGFDNSKLGSRGKLSGLGLERHMEDKDST